MSKDVSAFLQGSGSQLPPSSRANAPRFYFAALNIAQLWAIFLGGNKNVETII